MRTFNSLIEEQEKVLAATAELEGAEVYLPENVDLNFFFSIHTRTEDLGDLDRFRRIISENDVIILEQAGWTQAALKGHNKVSRGDRDELEYQRIHFEQDGNTYSLTISETIFDTHKPVVFIDVSEKDPAFPASHRLMRLADAEEVVGAPLTDDFEESVSYAVEAHEGFAIAQRYRERKALSLLGPSLDRVLARNPDLAQRDTVRALWLLGSAHTSLYLQLRNQYGDERVKRSFGSSLPYYPAGQIIQRAALLGVNELKPEDKRKAVTYGFMHQVIRSVLTSSGFDRDLDTYQTERLAAKVNSELTIEDIERYFSLDEPKQVKQIKAFQGRIRKLAKAALMSE